MADTVLTDIDDTFFDWATDDRIWGEGGNDRLFGSGGNDILYGGTGNDTIYVGAGGQGDRAYGGQGVDQVTLDFQSVSGLAVAVRFGARPLVTLDDTRGHPAAAV